MTTFHDPNKPKQVEDRFEAKHDVPEGASAVIETTEEIRVTTPPEICGMGHRMKRKEDPRFIQGKGHYVDDVKLPGMLYMDIVRSPYAHAKILNIDASAALEMNGVLAVITGVMTAIELLEINMARTIHNMIFLALSIIKAVLVAMYYMHLKMDSRVYTAMFMLPVFLVLILVAVLLL